MPIYNFQCQSCQHTYEALVPKMGDTAVCPACGAQEVKKQISAPADYKGSYQNAGPACPSCPDMPACGGGMCGMPGR